MASARSTKRDALCRAPPALCKLLPTLCRALPTLLPDLTDGLGPIHAAAAAPATPGADRDVLFLASGTSRHATLRRCELACELQARQNLPFPGGPVSALFPLGAGGGVGRGAPCSGASLDLSYNEGI